MKTQNLPLSKQGTCWCRHPGLFLGLFLFVFWLFFCNLYQCFHWLFDTMLLSAWGHLLAEYTLTEVGGVLHPISQEVSISTKPLSTNHCWEALWSTNGMRHPSDAKEEADIPCVHAKGVEKSSIKPVDFISQKQLTIFSIIFLPISNLLSNQLLIFKIKRCLIFWTKNKMVESIWESNIDILENHCSEVNFTEILWMTHTAILNFSQRISTLSKLSHQSLLCFFKNPYLLEIV